MDVHGQYGWYFWALGGLKLTHTSLLFHFCYLESRKNKSSMACDLTECTIKDTTSWALIVLSKRKYTCFDSFWLRKQKRKKEFASSLKWRMCVRVSPSWSLVSVVAHPNDRRSHPIQPTNPFAYLHILHICQSIGCIVKTSFPHSFSVASPRIPLKHIVSQMPNHGLCSTMNTIFLPYLMRF